MPLLYKKLEKVMEVKTLLNSPDEREKLRDFVKGTAGISFSFLAFV